MTNLLVKIFIKDYEKIEDENVREKYGLFSGIVGIISNIILVLLKSFVGIISGSLSIIADAINNLSDTLSSIITLIGFKLSRKDADNDHPFGHERIEYLAGFIIALIILFVGLSLIIESIKKIFVTEELTISVITLTVLGLSIIIKLWQYHFYNKLGKRIDSLTLCASGKDSLNDVLATSAVLISSLIVFFFKINIDAYIGILVSIFIIRSGIELIKETSSPLIGVLPKKELVDKLLNIILDNEKILGYHDLVIHSYGPNKFYATCHVEFNYEENILEIHDIIDNIEKKCFDDLSIKLVIHMDPISINDEEILIIKKKLEKYVEDNKIDISFHDFRIVKGNTHTNVLFDCVIPLSKDKSFKLKIKCELERIIKSLNDKYDVIISFDDKLDYR